jgi:hypothetical protein
VGEEDDDEERVGRFRCVWLRWKPGREGEREGRRLWAVAVGFVVLVVKLLWFCRTGIYSAE